MQDVFSRSSSLLKLQNYPQKLIPFLGGMEIFEKWFWISCRAVLFETGFR